MNEPVAVPVGPEPVIERRERSAIDEGQILDEGLNLSGYRGTHGSPYPADFFGLRDLYKTNPQISQQIDEVSMHLQNKMEGEGIVYAAKEILDQYEQELNLSENDSGIYKLKKVLQLIRVHDKLNALEQAKAQAMADIENMV